ncbi:MFS transporter [Kitasatospora sp. NPDC086801]|uniref:MFS transporter n=1 Tax=Kitasatospora sp. NPDC086801 TaxID=3364066 RepID=UPI00380C8AA0
MTAPVPPGTARLLTVCVASVGGLLFGYGIGVIAGVLRLVAETFALSSWQQGAVVSAALLGAALTALTSGRPADRFGRRPVIGAAAAVYALGTAVSAAASDSTALLAGRFLVGLALGATSFAVPLYISEISPPAQRGALVTLNQLMITVGLLLSYVVAYLLEPAGAWRWMLALGLLPACVLLAGMCLVPESPDWLHTRGDAARAASAARRLSLPDPGGPADSPGDRPETHPGARVRTHQRASPGVRPATATATRPAAGRAVSLRQACALAGPRWVALGLAIAVLVHLTGLNTAIYYVPTILGGSGVTAAGGILGAVLVGLCNVAATIVTIALLDRVGRRKTMIGGLLVMAVAAVGIAVAQPFGLTGAPTAALLCFFIMAGAVGPAAVFWVYIAEIYPAGARGVLMSLATAAHWATDFVVATTFLPLVQELSLGGAFGVYATISAASALALSRWMPETRGRLLL